MIREEWIKKGEALLTEIRDAQPDTDEIMLWRIGQCGYVIRYGNKVIYIDPILNDIAENGMSRRYYEPPFSAREAADIAGADYVICTHGHADHLAGETVLDFMQADRIPAFIVPSGCRKAMETISEQAGRHPEIIYMQDGQSRNLTEDMTIRALSAAHPKHYLDADDENMALCYQLKLGSKTIIHLGDTYLTEGLYEGLMGLVPPDVFLPPINGDDLFRKMRNCIGNMEAEEAAKLAVRLKAGTAIPTHYDMIRDNTVDPRRFSDEMERLGAADHCRILKLGECILT